MSKYSISFHESYLLKIICVFSKLEYLLPKARNQLWWKLSVQLKHHGRMENIRGKIMIVLFLQLAQVVFEILLLYITYHIINILLQTWLQDGV